MKKLLFLSAAALSLFSSCKKENDTPDQPKTVYKTVNVALNMNETYVFALPTNQSDDKFQITKEAQHFLTSALTEQKSYTYTPALNYVGNDQVVISTVEEEHKGDNAGEHHGEHHDGNCNATSCNEHHDCNEHHNDEVEQVITINFVIKNNTSSKYGSAVANSIH